jgi:type IV secretory pathway VirB3-like protein
MHGTSPADRPHRDTLFVANTRPAAPGGVPLLLWMIGVGGVVAVVLATMNPAWMLLLLPVWAFLKAKASKDMHLGEILLGWALGAGRSAHRTLWGGSTAAPLPTNPRRFGILR